MGKKHIQDDISGLLLTEEKQTVLFYQQTFYIISVVNANALYSLYQRDLFGYICSASTPQGRPYLTVLPASINQHSAAMSCNLGDSQTQSM